MTNWLMSANEGIFNHELAFNAKGYIDWKQTRKYCKDDVVFIYCTKPTSRIKFMTKVLSINESIDEIEDDTEFWMRPSLRDYNRNDKFFRISLISCVDHEDLSLSHLQTLELLKYPPQSPQKLNENLAKFLRKYFKNEGEKHE